jgi:hypothetical protein
LYRSAPRKSIEAIKCNLDRVSISPLEGSSDFKGTLTSQGFNLIGATQGAEIIGITTGNQLNAFFELGPLQYNGGPT